MEHTTIAVDLAKSVFQVAVARQAGCVDEERRLSRDRVLEFFAPQPPATIVLEACGSAHFWARQLQPFGHEVRLLAPHDVRPYVRRNKTDRADAKGSLRPTGTRRFTRCLSRASDTTPLRPGIVCARRGWRPAPRGSTRSAGCCENSAIFIPVGAQHVVLRVRGLLAEPSAVPVLLHTTLAATCDEIGALAANMQVVERQLAALASQMPDVTLLQTVPGVGLIAATALVALVTDSRRFRSGRQFASSLGLTPREESRGSRRRLGAISKRGDVYLRMLLTHGARSFLWHAKAAKPPTSLQRWAIQTEQRRGHHVATVAVANTLARNRSSICADYIRETRERGRAARDPSPSRSLRFRDSD